MIYFEFFISFDFFLLLGIDEFTEDDKELQVLFRSGMPFGMEIWVVVFNVYGLGEGGFCSGCCN